MICHRSLWLEFIQKLPASMPWIRAIRVIRSFNFGFKLQSSVCR